MTPTDRDSLQAVVAELREWKALPHCQELADRLERLDAEMRNELERAERWRDLHKAASDKERAVTDDAIAEIAYLRARLAACEEATDAALTPPKDSTPNYDAVGAVKQPEPPRGSA